jgi:hypothetical protein
MSANILALSLHIYSFHFSSSLALDSLFSYLQARNIDGMRAKEAAESEREAREAERRLTRETENLQKERDCLVAQLRYAQASQQLKFESHHTITH